jgi:DNA-binding response OmpR family regulator
MRAVSDRIVLVIDEDAEFQERLTSLLSALGVRVETARGEDQILELLGRRIPEAVFIAVDLPEKEGYALFSKIKKARRRVPVALVTSTISRSDLKLHEKLKVHAEAYLDKRAVTEDELREAIETRLSISPPEPSEEAAKEVVEVVEKEELAKTHPTEAAAEPLEAPRSAIEPWLAELLDPETNAILADLDEETSLSGASKRSTVEGEVSPERVAELEEELEGLRQELEHARRDARSSPFSSEFLALREEASAKDKRLRALQEALGRRDSQVAVVKAKLTDLARKLLETRRENDLSREQVSDLKGELEAAQGKLQRLFDEVEEHERKREEEAKALRKEIADADTRHAEARRELESEIASLKASHGKARENREDEHASSLEALERKLRDQKSQLADELKSKYGEKLEELQSSHGRDLAALREEHQKETQSTHDSYRETAARAALEAQEALHQASENSASALEGANRQRLAELARAEEKQRADLTESDKRHRDELQALAQKHRAEKEMLARDVESSQARIERMSAEFGAKVQDVVKCLDEERARHQETRERYEQELGTLQTAHSKHVEQSEQDQFSALAGLSRKFREDRTRLMEIERQKWEETARTLHLDHARALEGFEKQYQDESAALKAAHEVDLRQKDAEGEQARKIEVEKARVQVQESFEKTLRGHADELASLRQEHEREASSLRAAHMEALQKRDRESQQAIREAVEAAKTDALDRTDRAREEAAEALASQRREYEEEITAFEKAHRETVAKLDQEAREALRRAEEERDEAREAADGLRAQMAEMDARHRSSSTLADEKHKSEVRELTKDFKTRLSQLQEEKQFLSASIEKLKRQSSTELTRALDSFAHEKKLHQSSQDRYERRLAELNLRHSEGIKQIEKDWMEKFELLEKTFNEKSEKAVSSLERDWRARMEKERFGHEEATSALTRDFEMELATVRQQMERSRGIEESYQAAARDLTTVKGSVEELTRSLAEAHNEIADRDRALQDQTRRLSEKTKTIASLKAVIDDFSRSVEGYMRDREESDQTISSLKAVIDDFYRGIDRENPGERKN